MSPLRVTVCGAGRTGHLSAVLFGQRPDVRVSLLTGNPDVAARCDAGVLMAHLPDGSTLTAHPDQVTTDPARAVADADIIILTVPAHIRPQVLRAIAPHLPDDKPVSVGAIPGFCGFDWLAATMLSARPNAVIWGMKDVPHTAFDLQPGVSVRVGGAKQQLHVGVHARTPAPARQRVRAELAMLYDAPVALLDDYLEITLTPGNPIMHSSVVYGLIGPYGQWHDRPFAAPLCWWTDCPELGAYFLERCDEENQALCAAVQRKLGVSLSSVKPLRQEIIEAYGAQIRDPRTMLSVLRTNQAYDAIRAPLIPCEDGGGYVIDRTSRAFHEDVAYGLALLVEMTRRLAVKAPHLSEIFDWTVSYMGGLGGSSLDYFPQAWPGDTR
ncbi:MAG TPA: NAD/NADP octopine/nopaline dehydrogenase family protein [Vineibacter sp.]|nr:NAD/NADP octopine/nopaline dehydrogenase family protein [Vineibacter sp.]